MLFDTNLFNPASLDTLYQSHISGIESMHMIRKGQAGTRDVLEEIDLINRLFCVA